MLKPRFKVTWMRIDSRTVGKTMIDLITLPKTNSSPLKIGHPKRNFIFQPSIFRCELLLSWSPKNPDPSKITILRTQKHPCVIQVHSPLHWRVQGFSGRVQFLQYPTWISSTYPSQKVLYFLNPTIRGWKQKSVPGTHLICFSLYGSFLANCLRLRY